MPSPCLPLLVPAIRLDRDDGAEEATALRRAREPWVAGFLLFGGEAQQVARLTARLREAAGRALFVASDMERGAGQQVAGLTRLPDAGLVGLAGDPRDARKLGELTAREARSVGVDVVFAPCVDVRSELENPILGNRSYGFDPDRVADLGAAHAAGLHLGGALAVAKHFPGHGATTSDSHDAVPVVDASAATLEARDLLPFHKVIAWSGCPGVMTAHVAYPALDPTGTIATFSRPIVDRARAFVHPGTVRGLCVFTDALLMAGAAVPGGEAEAARRALAAGCDALLYPEDPEAVAAALARPGYAAPADLERAAGNVRRFAALAAATVPEAPDPDDGAPRDQHAHRVARRAVALVGPLPEADALLVIDDDDLEDRGAVLARAAAREGVPFELVRVPRGEEPALAPPRPGASGGCDRVVVVFASVRAWKGSAGASPACRELVARARARILAQEELPWVVWCAPRREDWRDTHLPGSGPHLEAALARRLLRDREVPGDRPGAVPPAP